MVTDFSAYTNAELQHITYNGKDSLADFGILITNATATGDVSSKSVMFELPYTHGAADMSRQTGQLYYNARSLHYSFKVLADSEQELCEKRAAIRAWLESDGDYEIHDSAEGGFRFVDCVLKNISSAPLDIDVIGEYITADFSCYPYKLSPNGIAAEIAKMYNKSWRGVIINNGIFAQLSILRGVEITKLEDQRYKLRISTDIEGLNVISVNTNLAVVSAEDDVPCYVSDLGFTTYLNSVDGYVTFTVITSNDPVGPAGEASLGAGVTYAADTTTDYYLDVYSITAPEFTINGTTVEPGKFEIADQPVNRLAVTNTDKGLYNLRFDSVERRL